jgi:hypothetical protein
LNLDSSIIWVGITNRFATLLNVEQKEGTTPFLTEEENEEYRIYLALCFCRSHTVTNTDYYYTSVYHIMYYKKHVRICRRV